MLKSETRPPAHRVSEVFAGQRARSEALSTVAVKASATAHDGRNGPLVTTRFVAGGRAILLLSLACWAALLGAALLLFG